MNDIENNFEDMLDIVYGSINVAGIEFPASRVLKELDINAFNLFLQDFKNNEKFNSILRNENKGEDYDIDD